MDFPRLLGEILANIAAFGANFGLQRPHLVHQRLHFLRRFRRQGCRWHAARTSHSRLSRLA